MSELKFNSDALYFIPLGGSEQFGVNLNAYGYDDDWLAVDCGIGFAGHRFPGIDILLPDPTFLADRADRLKGLVITHAHEDHIGAVAHLWKRLKCPIYCSAFTAVILRLKMNDEPGNIGAKIHVVNPGDVVDIGPFKCEFIHVAHSIPNALAMVIETPVGRVLHSGDWNMDPRPIIGDVTDEAAFRRAGDKGILAYIGDSTNAEVQGRAGSESDVEQGLEKVFSEIKGRIAITLFASNIGRVASICKAAKAQRRKVVLMGRSLHRMVGAALECGYLRDIPEFVDDRDMDMLSPEETVIIMTGSQGETNAVLSRVSRGEHPYVRFQKGDTVIFSARAIPGNEEDINAVKNNLAATGVNVIGTYDTPHTIHVSGHPCREEILDMYRWVRPKIVVPVHGERAQLEAQARLARESQIKTVIVPNNGSVIEFRADGTAEIIDHIATGLLAVEPNRIVSADHRAISARRKLQFTGAIHITLVLDGRNRLADDPQVTTMGLIDPDDPEDAALEEDISIEIEDALADLDKINDASDDMVAEQARIAARRLVSQALGLKPKTTVHIVRV
jgi:ribonuclease J